MRHLLTACLCLLFILFSFRPPLPFEVKGKIMDEKGSPIIGASIVIKGTNTGTSTPADGTFKLSISTNKAILVISSVGFDSKEVEVSALKYTVTITLFASSAKLEEVVVTAYGIDSEGYLPSPIGTVNRKNKTLSISSQTLSGKISGVNIVGANGTLASGATIDSWKKIASSDDNDFNREGYDAIMENRFFKVIDNPLSTFSIDVDAASYSNVRRLLSMGQSPPAGAVRIEEMINYFKYDYPQPENENPFSINTEIAECPWNNSHKLVLIGLQGKQIATENLPPINMVFLVDVSGSMEEENKLPLVKQSIKLLADQLRSQDKVAIVVYAGNAGLVLPSTSGDEKMKIKDAIERLQAGGSTAGGAGIQLAYKIATDQFIKDGNNRVILCTDGDFNVGPSSDDELERIIEKEKNSGVFLTVLGYGTGNYQDAKMQKLADKGNGNHSYIDNYNEARKVLVSEFGGTLFTIAKDVKLQIEFNQATVEGYRLIGYENRLLNKEDFNNDKKDAGELGSGHTVTALYELIPKGVKSEFLEKTDPLKYQQQNKTVVISGNELMTIKFRYKKPDGNKSQLLEHVVINSPRSLEETSDNFRFAASVAQFGMLLRNSEFKQNASFDKAWKMASGALGKDTEGYRTEFLQLIKNAQSLASSGKETEEENISKK